MSTQGAAINVKVWVLAGLAFLLGLGLWRILDGPGRGPAGAPGGKSLDAEAAGTSAPAAEPPPGSDAPRRALPSSENVPAETHDLLVQVVDGEGRPRAGVPVAIQAGERLLLRARTGGEQGLASFPGASLACLAGTQLRVVLAFPHTKSAPVPLDGSSLPPEPVRLVLPPLGSVKVRLTDPDGVLVPLPLRVKLSGSERLEGAGSRPAGHAETVEAAGGEALFPFVGLGLDLAAGISGASYPSVKGRGPEKAGEVVRLDLALEERAYTVLIGRALGPGGEVLAGIELQHSWVDAGMKRRIQPGLGPPFLRFWTDESGQFALALGDLGQMEKPRFLELTGLLATPDGKNWISGRPELHLPLPQGEVHLGDVRLETVPLVAAGTVRDGSGSPIPGALVSVVIRPDSPRMEKGISDAAGRFRIQGYCDAASVDLFAHKEGLLPGPKTSVPVGAAEVALVLGPPGGCLSASVLLPSGIPPGALNVCLLHPPAELRGQTRPKPDGTFQMDQLPPGLYRLEIALHREPEPFWVLSDLELKPGESTDIGPIDLRERIHAFQVLVEDERGAPLPGAMTALVPEGPQGEELPVGEATYRGATDRQGGATLYASRPSMILQAYAWGRRTQSLLAAPGLNRVVLRAGIPVKLVLKESVELPEPPLFLFAQPLHAGQRFLEESWVRGAGPGSDGRIDPEGATRLLLPGPGRYRIHWMLMELSPDAGPTEASRWSFGLKSPEIEVLDQDQEQHFTVGLGVGPEEWRKLLEDLKKRL